MQRSWRVEPAELDDVAQWLLLAREVEPLFGETVDRGFDRAIRANVERGSAFCVHDSASGLVGGLLFDRRGAPRYEITWLAVAARFRRQGVAEVMVRHVLASVMPPCVVDVVTFGRDHPGGRAARGLYEALGFAPAAIAPRGPEGGSRQVYTMRIPDDGTNSEENI
jgi:ribosomal protein S18 acetylase RimI-like enzyme